MFGFRLCPPPPFSHPVRVLNLVKPFTPILPEIEAPVRKVQLREKLLWTVVTLYAVALAVLDCCAPLCRVV